MRKFVLFICLTFGTTLIAQKNLSLTPTIALQMPSGGNNGAAVVYHPKNKEYHACYAGNASFDYVIFDEDGNIKSKREAGADIRGLWLVGNEILYNTYQGENQPAPNSVGSYSTKKKCVIFIHNDLVFYYKAGSPSPRTIKLKIPEKSDYNTTSVGYTGKKNMEIVLLNVSNRRLEFYSEKSQVLTATVEIPKKIRIEDSFNFSITNDIAFFFNTKDKMWYGMKIEF